VRVQSERDADRSYGVVDATAQLDDEPAVRAVDDIFQSAIACRASDVHIEPWSDGGRVRQRVDGVLRETRTFPAHLFPRIQSRIKLLAGMDIADRRLPQDGRYAVDRLGQSIDARISSMPTIDGETLALRLLETRASIPTLEALGMPAGVARAYRELVASPSGFIVVCGPTGSGKTTTLYSSLMQRCNVEQHLCSIEDPVEIRIPGTSQVQVNVRAGLTFAVGLRSLLRQDPNVVMVGEMRDAETASIATSAALCGQLVATTLHSTDALAAIERLRDLGVSARSAGTAITALLSQRLVRQLCPACKTAAPAGAAGSRFAISASTIVAEAAGCERCDGTGYRGRSGLFELIVMTPSLRGAIERDATPAELRSAALDGGFEPLSKAAAGAIRRGETSIAEVGRVIGYEPL
jgi:type II secretory ATPase GspE/PulE/Tfp pilus assembly ATPase PilB-like protein